jgi:hypothetical protein
LRFGFGDVVSGGSGGGGGFMVDGVVIVVGRVVLVGGGVGVVVGASAGVGLTLVGDVDGVDGGTIWRGGVGALIWPAVLKIGSSGARLYACNRRSISASLERELKYCWRL